MSANNCFLFTFFYRYLYRPSRGTLDEFTDIFSRRKKDITLVQVGANDGINNDPVHKFIKRDKWKGILLEPQRYVFEEYLKPLYRKTKGIIPLNAALDKEDGFKPIYKISISNSRWATGLTSFNREVLERAVRSGYIARQAKKEGCRMPENESDCISEEMVECIKTSSLMEKFGLKKIDWLQIDTEGYDFEIIKMFNPTLYKPEVIVYENLHLNDEDRLKCKKYLEECGYRIKDYGPNTLAMLNPPEYLERFF